MAFTVTTSRPLQALSRGVLAALCSLALLWAIGLPLDWTICLVLTLAIGIPMGFYFYDDSTAGRRRDLHPGIVMDRVVWNFAEPVCENLDEFISMVTARQPTESGWTPHQLLPVRGRIEIEFAQWSHSQQPETVVSLNPTGGGGWTHAALLSELHKSLHHDCQLQGATFFEGLVKCGNRRYHLFLGS